MENINARQKKVLEFIGKNDRVQNRHVREFLEKSGESVTRITIIRDLEWLCKNGLTQKEGAGRSVRYFVANVHPLLHFLNREEYFSLDQDNRNIRFPNFRFGVFDECSGILSPSEEERYSQSNEIYRHKKALSSPTLIKKEFERITIELSWKSSQIEGNTYSLIDTEILLKERKEAPGHKKEEAIMILNHKSAFDFILENPKRFHTLKIGDIETIHSLLVSDLGVTKGMRTRPVGITGTNYHPLDNQHQIREAIEKMIREINAEKNPLSKALLASIFIAYIQPFEDGNKRTSRLLSNALLLANDYCPLSFRSVDEAEYKKAVLLFYEQNSMAYFKELFLEQFLFAVDHSFGTTKRPYARSEL